MESPPKRLHLKSYIPASVCKELQFIHKSCNVAGYRPFVVSTTLFHLAATCSLPLIMPFLSIREAIKELVEESFGCEFELFVEFTGIISWMKGAKIGWHSDNGRTYLKQRHFTEGSPATVVPEIGDVLIYKAADVHCVDEITQGERCTLALWFTKDSSCDEDVMLLDRIRLCDLNSPLKFHATLTDESEQNVNGVANTTQTDIRIFRLSALSLEFCITVGSSLYTLQEIEGWHDEKFATVQDGLEKTITLKSSEQVVPYVFANSIHALQVLYFCEWKDSLLKEGSTFKAVTKEGSNKDHNGLFSHFLEWEEYMNKNYEELQRCFPTWNYFKRIC